MKNQLSKLLLRCLALLLAITIAIPPVSVRAEGTDGEDTSHEHAYGENDICACGELNPEHEHSYTSVVTAPTCTAAGFTTYTCACGDSYTGDEQAQLSHVYSEDGRCACGELNPEHKHTYSEGKCVCGEEEPAHEHTYGENDLCTCGELNPEHEHTYSEGKCVCGEEEPVHEHAYGENDICACGELNPEHEHSYTSVVTVPTCTAAGFTTYTCICGDSYTGDDQAQLSHVYGENDRCTCGELNPDAVVTPDNKIDETSKGPLLTSTGPGSEATEQILCGVAWRIEGTTLILSKATTVNPYNDKCTCAPGEMCTGTNYAKDSQPWIEPMDTITALVVESGVTRLGSRVCNGSSSLTSADLGSITSMGERCFQDCTALTNITLPSTLGSLGQCVFAGCTALKTADLSSTQITSVPEKTFTGCSSLTMVSLPGTVTSISSNIFVLYKVNGTHKVANLTTLNYDNTLAAWNKIENRAHSDNPVLKNGTCTVFCTDGIWVNGYTSSGTNMCYKLADGTLTIRCFGELPDYEAGGAPWAASADAITAVVFEGAITKVGANAFEGCIENLPYTYAGDFETLKKNSSLVGNTALFGEPEPEEEPEQVSGGIAWTLVDGILTISAATTPAEGYDKGAMPDYEAGSAPWYADPATVTSVVLVDDITRVGANAFEGFGEAVTYTYTGNMETLKTNSDTTGNEIFFGVEEEPEPTPEENVTGGIVWKLEDGVLTIAPAVNPEDGYEKGQMRTDYTSPTAKENKFPVPWAGDPMETITALVVEPGVTNLAPRVCTDAINLTSVSLPNGLTSIGERCFSGCVKLESITLPDSVTSIGEVIFNGCTSLTEVDISNTKITTLPRKAFAACSALTTLRIPGTVTDTVVKGDTVIAIAAECFGDTEIGGTNIKTSKLKSLYFDGTLSQWQDNVTVGSKNSTLSGGTCTVYCTDGIWVKGYTSSGTNMCYKLDGTTLTIRCNGAMPDYDATGDNVAPWASSASTITTVVFEGSITYVGKNAFYGCNTLTCTYEGLEALKEAGNTEGNDALFGSTEPAPVPEPNTTGGVLWTLDEAGVLTLSPATVPESDAYTPGQMPELYGNDSATGAPWFDDMSKITSVVVLDGVTQLSGRAFTGAENLTSVSLPDTLTAIGARCFQRCVNLKSITVPSNVSKLGECAFVACKSLEVVDLSSNTGITEIGAKTFAGCRDLTTLYLPGSVGTLANNVFTSNDSSDTANLTKLYYGGTLAAWTAITNHAASNNVNLNNGKCTVICTDGVWANGFESSGTNMCYKIENGTLTIRCFDDMPDYEAGGAPWFEEASSVTTIVFEDGITAIGDNAFEGFVNLTDVTLPEEVTKVGENAFADCENLTTVHFFGTPAQWTALQQASEDGNDPLFRITATNGYNGVCGDKATWEYDPDTKTLTISGTGPMWDWNQRTYKNTPWIRFNDEIETIRIEYGITNTGRYAFCYMSALKNLVLVTNDAGFTTVETIGGYCFCWENQLTTLTLPEGVRFLSGRAFSRCESIATVYFPSTLESIDMYAFKSEDAAVTINKVIYNGTKEDWERKVYVSTQGDNHSQLYGKNTEWVYLKNYSYYDDINEIADAVYYLKDQGMLPEGNVFGVAEPATLDWVLPMLYIRAGSSGAYTDALDWARAKSVVDKTAAMADTVTLDALCNILYRTTLYNGNVADLGDGTALTWCADYIPAELADLTGGTVLNRMQAASILAAFLQSDNGSASRYDEMREDMKTAYDTTGGDSKMHILALHHAGTGKVGDSTLILFPGGETMLIDTFRNDGWKNYLKATLDSLQITNLDYLVLSHGHEDHDANLTDVIDYIYKNGYTIGNYWSAGSVTSTNEKNAIAALESKGGVNILKKLRAGQTQTIGSGSNTVTAEILWPMDVDGKGYNGSESNDGSLVMKLIYGDSSYLCGGDLFLTAEEDILEMYKDNPDALKADVMKTNHHGSYSSNGSNWVAAVDPKAMITHSDDTGDSAQCYEYSQDGRAWFSAGRDGGVLITMDGEKNITITTGYDTNLRQDVVSCGMKGHTFENQKWKYDETEHWRKCSGYWLCGVIDSGEHSGGIATCQSGKLCTVCGYEYTEVGGHDWIYTASANAIIATCNTCGTPGGSWTLICQEAAPVYSGTEKVVRVSGTIEDLTVPTVVYEGNRIDPGTFTASITLGEETAELTVTISKRSVTVTAEDQAIAHGSTISGTKYNAEGLVEGHTLTVGLTPSTSDPTTSGTITPSNAVITANGTDVTANYTITYVNGKLVIEQPADDAAEKAEAVEAAISKLPATVEPDDEKAADILAAKEAYDALSAYEKTLVDETYSKKLADLVDSLDDYKVIKGNGGKYTKGSSEGLTFTFNGPFSKFIGIKVNGYEVAEQYYDAKAGSTIITLKQSYLKNLTARKHTITVLYTDGEATAEFTVQAKATTPATGDDSGIMIWTAVFFISTMSLTALVVYQKKFAYKGKYVRK